MISPYRELLDQLPGMIVCSNLNRQVVYANGLAMKLMGFQNEAHATGCLLEEIPCGLAKYAYVFTEQNNLVDKTSAPLKLLDIHTFFDNQIRAFLTIKTPLDFSNGQRGVLAQCTQISRSFLLNISMKIAESDKKFRQHNNIDQRSYQIGEKLPESNLSSRELECLFYLIRGKSAVDIANILSLSKRTIESYIENLKTKMHCSSKAALIEKAINNNFIDFIPETLLASGQTNFSVRIDD